MPKVVAAGTNLRYEAEGGGDPLLLVVGLGASGELWGNQVPLLARGFRVITLDNRGTKIGLPVLHMTQLIGLALGIDPPDLGFERHTVSVKGVLDKLGL